MVYYMLIDELNQRRRSLGELINEISRSSKLEERLSREIEEMEKIRQSLLERLDITEMRIKQLMLKKDNAHYYSIPNMNWKKESMERIIEDAKVVDLIVVDEEKYGLKNGLVDLNRDCLMKLIRLLNDEKKIRYIVGMMEIFYVWSKLRIFKWARDKLTWSNRLKSNGIRLSDSRRIAEVVSSRGKHVVVIGDKKFTHGIVKVSIKMSDNALGVLCELSSSFASGFGPSSSFIGWCLYGDGYLHSKTEKRYLSLFGKDDLITIRVDVDKGDLEFTVNDKNHALKRIKAIRSGVYLAAQMFSYGSKWTLEAGESSK